MRNPFRNRERDAAKSQQEPEPSQSIAENGAFEQTLGASATAESQLDAAFEEAASRLESSVGSAKLDQDDLLTLYGLYKQATSGPCTTFRPPFFELKARSKWCGAFACQNDRSRSRLQLDKKSSFNKDLVNLLTLYTFRM